MQRQGALIRLPEQIYKVLLIEQGELKVQVGWSLWGAQVDKVRRKIVKDSAAPTAVAVAGFVWQQNAPRKDCAVTSLERKF